MVHAVRVYDVSPSLPANLEGLAELSYNLYWSWNPETVELFRRIDPGLWQEVRQNPVRLLGDIAQERLDELSQHDGFCAHLQRQLDDLKDYLTRETWYGKRCGQPESPEFAYFSAEFGLTNCLPSYSGGLGILAGDHLKSASDLGLPLVAVGLAYQFGYFQQYLNSGGWQQETYPANDFYRLPLQTVKDDSDEPVFVEIPFPEGPIRARIWRVQVGRVPLYLLDTNIPDNPPEGRSITGHLYGGDRETRIRQEMVLGIGGVRALRKLGLAPKVFHMNEGHSAFLAVERMRELVQVNRLTFEEAIEASRAGSVFTTHTPVPAGIDHFDPKLVDRYLAPWYRDLGIDREIFLGMGRANPFDHNSEVNMAVLAIRSSTSANGVSKLHGEVSRRMWRNLWAELPLDEVPITSVTNGVHMHTWVSREMSSLLSRYLGPEWISRPSETSVWDRVDEIPDEELWRVHERRRSRLIAFARRRLKRQHARRGATREMLNQADEVLDHNILTIGFARRFATYKRAALLLHDPERLKRILLHKDCPVQILFAGKAHPQDDAGKDLIRSIVQFAAQEDLRTRIVFIEDYDMNVARYLVQGVDVWLNTPRRPLEASGTSGMKVIVNGGLNASVLDGWWSEGYDAETGWAIGNREEYSDPAICDEIEANALYDLLEREIAPLFYDRANDSLPRGWLRRMKHSMHRLGPEFSSNRMVREYAERYYIPAMTQSVNMADDNFRLATDLAAWKQQMRRHWHQIELLDFQSDVPQDVRVSNEITVRAKVQLGSLQPDDVRIEIYHGPLNADQEIEGGIAVRMSLAESAPDGVHEYTGTIECLRSGRHGHTVRVLPARSGNTVPFEPGFIYWLKPGDPEGAKPADSPADAPAVAVETTT